ncbi:MAG: ribosome maturation factor RimM [Vulcanimicrobiaceae bacterium]
MTTPKAELPIGRIAGLFGIRGELKCDPTTSGRTVFSPGATLRCVIEGNSQSVRLTTVREHKGRLLVRLDDVQDATSAQRYIGATFFAPREQLDVASDEYLDIDLIGCKVVGRNGEQYGLVERVEHYPANDMLLVDGRMLPMVKAFICEIDIADRRIVVDVPPGLLDDDAIDDATAEG